MPYLAQSKEKKKGCRGEVKGGEKFKTIAQKRKGMGLRGVKNPRKGKHTKKKKPEDRPTGKGGHGPLSKKGITTRHCAGSERGSIPGLQHQKVAKKEKKDGNSAGKARSTKIKGSRESPTNQESCSIINGRRESARAKEDNTKANARKGQKNNPITVAKKRGRSKNYS